MNINILYYSYIYIYIYVCTSIYMLSRNNYTYVNKYIL